jgi:hypothetical protein
VNERATCRQIERDGVAVKNDPQSPFASEVPAYIAGQSAYEASARQHKETERPLHREGDGSKANHDTGDADEKDHPKEGEQSRRERHPKNAPLVRVAARRNSSGAIGNVVHDWTPDEASYRVTNGDAVATPRAPRNSRRLMTNLKPRREYRNGEAWYPGRGQPAPVARLCGCNTHV